MQIENLAQDMGNNLTQIHQLRQDSLQGLFSAGLINLHQEWRLL